MSFGKQRTHFDIAKSSSVEGSNRRRHESLVVVRKDTPIETEGGGEGGEGEGGEEQSQPSSFVYI
jgi:hypothetical protein